MVMLPMKTIAGGMLRENTPLEDYSKKYGLIVKREDLSCPPPGPPFSKTRGVYAHIATRPEKVIGVLDTVHSQAGWAVARACEVLGKTCWNYFPKYKADVGEYLRPPQIASSDLGAVLVALTAGRSCILYHAAKKDIAAKGGYMMPNALKLEESVAETAKEVPAGVFDQVIIPASSGTIAAGVIRGFYRKEESIAKKFIIHLGYSRSTEEVLRYIEEMSGASSRFIDGSVVVVDEGYAYKDKARRGETPPWPCNEYYDLKAFRWWLDNRSEYKGSTLFWNIG